MKSIYMIHLKKTCWYSVSTYSYLIKFRKFDWSTSDSGRSIHTDDALKWQLVWLAVLITLKSSNRIYNTINTELVKQLYIASQIDRLFNTLLHTPPGVLYSFQICIYRSDLTLNVKFIFKNQKHLWQFWQKLQFSLYRVMSITIRFMPLALRTRGIKPIS